MPYRMADIQTRLAYMTWCQYNTSSPNNGYHATYLFTIHMIQFCLNIINFLLNTHNRHPISGPRLLWVETLRIYVLSWWYQCCTWIILYGCHGYNIQWIQIHGLVHERRSSSALAMELHLSWTSPSKCEFEYEHTRICIQKYAHLAAIK